MSIQSLMSRPVPRALALMMAATFITIPLVACFGGGGGSDGGGGDTVKTPTSIRLSTLGRYSTGIYEQSAAEIPAFDAASRRAFVVNAQSGKLDVLDLSTPASPSKIDEIDAGDIVVGAEVNSVAVQGGIVAIAIQAPVKTDNGYVALYDAATLLLLGSEEVGALPDMLTFTPDGETLLVANEGEPSDDYQIDPVGSVSVIDVRDPANMVVRTAGFDAWIDREDELRAAEVRIYGPGANAAQDLEPEYIAVSQDGATAWVVLQENNALAKIDIASATVTDIFPLGYKDHGVAGNGIDASDDPKELVITTRPGVLGMYQPDAMVAYRVNGQDYLVMANEGDARAWGEDNGAYWAGDASLGFVEEFRVKHLINANGWGGRAGNDLPPQLDALANGGLLNPAVFGWCGAVAGNPGGCRADGQLGRLNISWTMGYRTDVNGDPVMFNAAGDEDPAGDRLMYDNLYAYGGRSFSIRDADGALVWDSGDAFEQYLASGECFVGPDRDIPCADYFNSGHNEGNAFDSRSDAKGPEPEGIELGQLGNKTFAFIGLERMGGVMVYDITDPAAPTFVDYYNSRANWVDDPATVLETVGDLGPEGLKFVSADDSPTGEPLLIVGNEVSGTTVIYRIEQTFN